MGSLGQFEKTLSRGSIFGIAYASVADVGHVLLCEQTLAIAAVNSVNFAAVSNRENAFEAHHHVSQVGDRGMPVLEVEAFEKALRIVRADPVDRLPDRIGRAAVARQGIGALLAGHRRHSENTLQFLHGILQAIIGLPRTARNPDKSNHQVLNHRT
jgi:hypothetical protein